MKDMKMNFVKPEKIKAPVNLYEIIDQKIKDTEPVNLRKYDQLGQINYFYIDGDVYMAVFDGDQYRCISQEALNACLLIEQRGNKDKDEAIEKLERIKGILDEE